MKLPPCTISLSVRICGHACPWGGGSGNAAIYGINPRAPLICLNIIIRTQKLEGRGGGGGGGWEPGGG